MALKKKPSTKKTAPKKASSKKQAIDADSPELKQLVRQAAEKYLKDPNINSVGIGYKVKDGKRTNEISVQFTVDEKLSKAELASKSESLGTEVIPDVLELNGLKIKTDVIKRKFEPSYKKVPQVIVDPRKVYMDPVQPGVSIGNVNISAGTFGCVVYDTASGEPYILSNWHVLNGSSGSIGDVIVQPGTWDDNSDINSNAVGKLKRSYLGFAGDCAIGTIENRLYDPKIYGLDIVPDTIVNPQLGDPVIKSGRTTGITHGVVRRIEVTVKINYGGITGVQQIGGFEIGYDTANMPIDGEISKGGDSGAGWLIYENGKATSKLVGLHFAGESDGSDDEHAIACNIDSVFKKLEIGLTKNVLVTPGADRRLGYQPNFLSTQISLPLISNISKGKVLTGATPQNPLDYMHFSIVMNEDRRMCYYTAVNIDGKQLRTIPRGDNWIYDNRIDEIKQCGNDIYSRNKLDRGHMVRRLDAVWGTPEVARIANDDTFHYTNSCPQHAQLNQREWNDLEEYILGNAGSHNLLVSVFTGPVFTDLDVSYRGIKIPLDFWKVVAFIRDDNRQLSVTAYQLTQKNFMNDLEEVFVYGAFRTYQVPLTHIQAITNIDFGDLHSYDPMHNMPQSIGYKPLERLNEIVF